MILGFLAVFWLIGWGLSSADAAPKNQCRDARGRFIKCLPPVVVSPPVPQPVIEGRAAIPTTDFNPDDGLQPSWGGGTVAPDNAADPVGAYRGICAPGQSLKDDPIVYPGQPGRSHRHRFYGNLKADAYSTYESLRASGESTCNSMPGTGKALQRSAYWMPEMLDGVGNMIVPFEVLMYYKRLPKSDPHCGDPAIAGKVGICIGIPTGLKMVAGKRMDGTATLNFRTDAGRQMGFKCYSGTVSGAFATIPEAMANCPVGARLIVEINFPDCWNGKDLDSPDHYSHVAYGIYGDQGYYRCPSSHPYLMPQLHIAPQYLITANKATYTLSVDSDMGTVPGTLIHADYMEAWDRPTRLMMEGGCIDGHRNCSGGDLGNGRQLRGAQSAPAHESVVPLP